MQSKTIIMYFHKDEILVSVLSYKLLLMTPCQELDALHIRILNRRDQKRSFYYYKA